jgi:hypothetical protein
MRVLIDEKICSNGSQGALDVVGQHRRMRIQRYGYALGRTLPIFPIFDP